MSGLFGTLNVGKSGLFTNQTAIGTTSHNIANANTEGYSRQRAEMQTTRPFCTPSMNNAAGPGQLGTGVEISQVIRVRDSFLDYQVRVELGVQGNYTGRDKFLAEIENILNEPSENGISKLIGKFFDGWQELGKHPETSSARTVVAEQSNALANELNHTYEQLQKLKKNTQEQIHQTVFDVNNIMNQIDQLNQEIIQIGVAGNNPNDLMDRRDLLLDKLSAKFGINIDKKKFSGIHVNTGTDPSANTPKDVNLVQVIDPEDVARFSYVSSIEPKTDTEGNVKYDITYYKNGDMTSDENKVVIKDVELSDEEFRQLDECRVLWTDKNGELLGEDGATISATEATETSPMTYSKDDFKKALNFTPSSGEFKGYMSVQQDIDNYVVKINKLAKALALSVNTIHGQSSDYKADTDEQIYNFFVNKDKEGEAGENEITAGNITVNKKLLESPMDIQCGIKDNGIDPEAESNGRRALAIAKLRDTLMSIQDVSGDMKRAEFVKDCTTGFDINNDLGVNVIGSKLDGMKVDNYFKDVVDSLGIQEQEARRMVQNQFTVLAGFEQSRASVSGVSLDEEMSNLIQYQHAYQANAKIISTVDQLLDVVINGLKR